MLFLEICFILQILIILSNVCFSDCTATEPSALAKDPELAKKLWEKSVEMVDLKDYDMFNCNEDTLPKPLEDA